MGSLIDRSLDQAAFAVPLDFNVSESSALRPAPDTPDLQSAIR